MDEARPIKHGTRHAYVNKGCRCDACREADRVYAAERRKGSPRVREQQRAATARHRERHGPQKRTPEQQRRATELEHGRAGERLYGISPVEYALRLEAQGGRCAICGNLPGRRRLDRDHCHETGKLRGLLCWKCNIGIGYFDDDPEVLARAIAYLAAARAAD